MTHEKLGMTIVQFFVSVKICKNLGRRTL